MLINDGHLVLKWFICDLSTLNLRYVNSGESSLNLILTVRVKQSLMWIWYVLISVWAIILTDQTIQSRNHKKC